MAAIETGDVPDAGRALDCPGLRSPAEGPLSGEIDAVWLVEDTIVDRELLAYSIPIEFRPDGCTSESFTLTLEWPQVVVSGVEIEPGTLPLGITGSEPSDCGD